MTGEAKQEVRVYPRAYGGTLESRALLPSRTVYPRKHRVSLGQINR